MELREMLGLAAQAMEPHGWMIDGMSEVMSRGHAQAVQAEHQAMGGTAVAYPVYLHPTPTLTPPTIWVLTSEYSDYDQHGKYLEAIFAAKPHHTQLSEYGVDSRDLSHVLNGGGRKQYEYKWVTLKEVTPIPEHVKQETK